MIKSRLIKQIFPTKETKVKVISLSSWRSNAQPFFFKDRDSLGNFPLSQEAKDGLKNDYTSIIEGHLQYFNSDWIKVGYPINWHHNPDSGYEYPTHTHWAYIADLSTANGDIKYVWEKSRFSYLYTLIRHDQHLGTDSSLLVFDLIEDWIKKNPNNQGPNYKCSQEISIRILNWIFALYYYKHSPRLNEISFELILNSIRHQLIHVYHNIHFSRLTVRNNHAITETMALYLVSLLFPSFPESKKYLQKGKNWFEEEIAYQIYPDGSYLQFSMNYHRVVVQLLTWAVEISKANNVLLQSTTLQRAEATVDFLYQHQDDVSGKLPNYGANDGALFFKLNQQPFLDYSPHINALSHALKSTHLYSHIDLLEDAWWFKGGHLDLSNVQQPKRQTLYKAETGGFYVLRDENYFAMLRCGNHSDRPQQADQNHLDLWYMGHNIVRDNGSYKYNTDTATINYFSGTPSHNTVQIQDHNQMLKGGRFIWYHWSQALSVKSAQVADHITIEAQAKVYQQLSKHIIHQRIVKQYHHNPKWEIVDTLQLPSSVQGPFKQTWHVSNEFFDLGFEIYCLDASGKEVAPKLIQVWHSPVYGQKFASQALQFIHAEPYFHTTIKKL